jgi:hypothetical protein
MKKFIIKPDITFYPGIVVDKDTNLEYENELVKQEIKDLKLHSIITEEKEEYHSKTDLTVNLQVGDILILDENRGYILPGIPLVTVEEEIEELNYMKEV